MKKITFEIAKELGLIKDNSLSLAYRHVEGYSIISNSTDIAFENAYKNAKKSVVENNKEVFINGKKFKVI